MVAVLVNAISLFVHIQRRAQLGQLLASIGLGTFSILGGYGFLRFIFRRLNMRHPLFSSLRHLDAQVRHKFILLRSLAQ